MVMQASSLTKCALCHPSLLPVRRLDCKGHATTYKSKPGSCRSRRHMCMVFGATIVLQRDGLLISRSSLFRYINGIAHNSSTLTSTLHPIVGGGFDDTLATVVPPDPPWQRDCTNVVFPLAMGPTTRTLAWLGSKLFVEAACMAWRPNSNDIHRHVRGRVQRAGMAVTVGART